jgi:arylsulfatase A-like enzyme
LRRSIDKLRVRIQRACLVAALSWLGAGCGAPVRDGLILVTVDTLRVGALGIFGHPDAHTPVLDRLAREGVHARAYTPIPLTTPAHATILTGLHPASHGLRKNVQRLSLRFDTLAEILGREGYATGAVAAAATTHPYWRLHQGFEVVDARELADEDRPAEEVTDAALEVLDRLLEERPEAPVFLWVHYFDPHSAYAPPEPYDRLWDDEPSPFDGSDELHNRVIYQGLAVSPELLRRNLNLYQGEVAYLDHELGRLLEGIEARGLGDALTAVVADHGESFAPEYPFDHADRLYDSILAVPLILRGAGLPASEKVFPGTLPLEDLCPTLLELRGHLAPPGLDGVSRAAELRGERPPTDVPIFAETARVPVRPDLQQGGLNRGALRAVQRGGCKLVWNLDREEAALYDLAEDPGDTRNLLQSSEPGRCDPDALRRLHAEWARVHPEALTQKWVSQKPPIDEDLRERLRALGYAVE